MIRKTTLLTISLLMVLFTVESQETTEEKASRMEWFKDAKLGIFVHYGIYAVDGIDESWSFFNGYITHDNYMDQLSGFDASNYNAERWVKLFKDAGAKYSVITTKHHDGVALWDSKTDHYNVIKDSPAKKDLISPFVSALRKNDLKVGLYYSLIDWSYPDYPAFKRDSVRYSDNPERWSRFVDFYFEQLDELSSTFNPDLYWFDGDWEHSADEWKAKQVREKLFSYNTEVIINSRLNEYGDYMTPEQGVPVARPENPYWELCLTMNDSWGYQHNDHNYKTPYQLLRTFVDCISKGGNLLLDVGPMQDGTIPEPQIEILKEFARWTRKHNEAIYGTRAGLEEGHFSGPTAVSKDNRTLYLYLDYIPQESLVVEGLQNEIKNVRVVGQKAKIDFAFDNSRNNLNIKIPQALTDSAITVIAVDFKNEVSISPSDNNRAMNLLERFSEDETWSKKHLPLMDPIKTGISTLHYAGHSLMSQDDNILYLLLDGKPNGPLMIKGLRNKINRIWVVGDGTKLSHKILGKLYWSEVPGIAYIEVPESVLDPKGTVIAVLLDGSVSLYTEEGQVIESN